MSKILALDTATEACSAALLVDDRSYCLCEIAPRVHTQRILPMIDALLAEAGLSLHQLDALAFGRGPGSFTGVRIGISVAQGLAFGADLPMIGISNLAALAQGSRRLTGAEQVMVAIDARMSEIYWGRFRVDSDGLMHPVEEEQVIKPERLAGQLGAMGPEWVLAGTGWKAYSEPLQVLTGHSIAADFHQLPEAQDLLPLAKASLARGELLSPEEATPVYLRDQVTWKKLPGR